MRLRVQEKPKVGSCVPAVQDFQQEGKLGYLGAAVGGGGENSGWGGRSNWSLKHWPISENFANAAQPWRSALIRTQHDLDIANESELPTEITPTSTTSPSYELPLEDRGRQEMQGSAQHVDHFKVTRMLQSP